MGTQTVHYVGKTPTDLEDGKGTVVTLLPGGLYTFDTEKDRAKLELLKKVPADELRMLATPSMRKPPAPPVREVSDAGSTDFSAGSHGKGKGR